MKYNNIHTISNNFCAADKGHINYYGRTVLLLNDGEN